MFSDNNILLLLVAIIPAITYSIIIYLSSYYKSIDPKIAFSYASIGGISTTMVLISHFVFPNWTSYILSDNIIASLAFKMFVQVALLEEICKYLTFKMVESARHGIVVKHDKPIATMFYICMISVGFAFVENIWYVKFLSDTTLSKDILISRSVSAVVVHMVCGLVMGYFITLGRLDTKLRSYSTLNILFKKNNNLKRIAYTTTGIIAASAVHGIYDFTISIGSNYHVIVTLALLLGLVIHRRINNETKEIQQNNIPKTE